MCTTIEIKYNITHNKQHIRKKQNNYIFIKALIGCIPQSFHLDIEFIFLALSTTGHPQYGVMTPPGKRIPKPTKVSQ
jgi:hypothetical protein